MRQHMLKTICLALALLILAVTSGLLSSSAGAAQRLRIGVTPAFVDLEGLAGETVSRTLTVSNEGEIPFAASNEATVFPRADSLSSALAWVKVEPSRLELEPGGIESVTVTITIPTDIASGSYFAQITITTDAVDGNVGRIDVHGQLTVPFLVAATGTGVLTLDAEVERFSPVLEADGRTGFRVEITNTGNKHLYATGQIRVISADRAPVTRIELPVATLVLPGETALLSGERSILLEATGSYNAVVQVAIGFGAPQTVQITFVNDTPALELADLRVCATPGGGASLLFELRNAGSLGLVPTINLAVEASDNSSIAAGTVPEPTLVWASDQAQLEFALPGKLSAGSYVLTVQILAGAISVMEQELPFRIGASGSSSGSDCEQPADPTGGSE